MSGTLFVVATPIGNLEDLTFRALRTLRSVDLIAAEDTRRTSKLLAHYEIRKTLVSLREHNEARETPRLLAHLAAGRHVALVSDAGTPGIADPGARLVREAHLHHVPVVPIPGASAVTAALSVSGLSGDQFVFLGFPPPSGSARQAWMAQLAGESRVSVFFEAPHRIRRTMTELVPLLGVRPIIVSREISKINEQLVVSPINIQTDIKELGEFTVVVGARTASETVPVPDQQKTADEFGRLTDLAGFSSDEAIAMLAASRGATQAVIRKLIKKARISDNQRNARLP
jgi:16S rRNA (cytidine1402-2'-O)-methyltransferase